MFQRSMGVWMALALFCLISYPSLGVGSERQVLQPTPLSMDFYGSVNGAQPGDEVTVLTGQGALCGRFVVEKPGQYGFLHVYGDDRTTEVREGASVNEPLFFYLNGAPLTPLSAGQLTWLGDGQRLRVDFLGR